MVCGGRRRLSQLRQAARVHRPVSFPAAARRLRAGAAAIAAAIAIARASPVGLAAGRRPWQQRPSTHVRRLPQTQGALAAAAGSSCSVIVIAAPGSVNETQRISSARSTLHCRKSKLPHLVPQLPGPCADRPQAC